MKRYLISIGITLALLASSVLSVGSAKKESGVNGTLVGENVRWQVVSGGSERASSTSYIVSGTVGQTAVREIASTGYKLRQGFWQDWALLCCIGTTGNTDGDLSDVVDISDAFAVVDYLGASIPLSSCAFENDVNIDATVDIGDLFAIIDYLSLTAGLPACP